MYHYVYVLGARCITLNFAARYGRQKGIERHLFHILIVHYIRDRKYTKSHPILNMPKSPLLQWLF